MSTICLELSVLGYDIMSVSPGEYIAICSLDSYNTI